jgi:hypothetical protein
VKVKLTVLIETAESESVEYIRNEVENMIENCSDWTASVEVESTGEPTEV